MNNYSSEEETLLNNGFDLSKFRFGTLCLRNHEFLNTQKSIRRMSNGLCPQCQNLKTRESEKKIPIESRKERSKNNYYKHKESRLEKAKAWKARNKERCAAWRKQRRLKHLEEEKANYRAYMKTERGRELMLYHKRLRRARKLAAGAPDYTLEELKERFELFNGNCVYCNNSGNAVDHFIPLTKGGKEKLLNLYLCCKSCNSSKGDRDAEVWYKSQSFFNPERWEAILLLNSDDCRDSYVMGLAGFGVRPNLSVEV